MNFHLWLFVMAPHLAEPKYELLLTSILDFDNHPFHDLDWEKENPISEEDLVEQLRRDKKLDDKKLVLM